MCTFKIPFKSFVLGSSLNQEGQTPCNSSPPLSPTKLDCSVSVCFQFSCLKERGKRGERSLAVDNRRKSVQLQPYQESSEYALCGSQNRGTVKKHRHRHYCLAFLSHTFSMLFISSFLPYFSSLCQLMIRRQQLTSVRSSFRSLSCAFRLKQSIPALNQLGKMKPKHYIHRPYYNYFFLSFHLALVLLDCSLFPLSIASFPVNVHFCQRLTFQVISQWEGGGGLQCHELSLFPTLTAYQTTELGSNFTDILKRTADCSSHFSS